LETGIREEPPGPVTWRPGRGRSPRPGCRRYAGDVDTGEDLLAALALGVGPHTALQAPYLAGGAAAGSDAPDGSRRPLPPQVRASGA